MTVQCETEMICPKCHNEQPDDNSECTQCGIVFNKYFEHHERLAVPHRYYASTTLEETRITSAGIIEVAKELLLHVKPDINPFYFAGRVLVYLIILFWGWKFILSSMREDIIMNSFMHLINLPFHEAGHIVFRPFGEFITKLGGSLLQLIVPFVCMVVFLFQQRDTFAASVAFWWLGQSIIDLSPYINDARSLKMILLGGVTGREVSDYHDWEFMLRRLGWLHHDQLIAHMAFATGSIIMIATFVWGGYLLFRQYGNINR